MMRNAIVVGRNEYNQLTDDSLGGISGSTHKRHVLASTCHTVAAGRVRASPSGLVPWRIIRRSQGRWQWQGTTSVGSRSSSLLQGSKAVGVIELIQCRVTVLRVVESLDRVCTLGRIPRVSRGIRSTRVGRGRSR